MSFQHRKRHLSSSNEAVWFACLTNRRRCLDDLLDDGSLRVAECHFPSKSTFHEGRIHVEVVTYTNSSSAQDWPGCTKAGRDENIHEGFESRARLREPMVWAMSNLFFAVMCMSAGTLFLMRPDRFAARCHE